MVFLISVIEVDVWEKLIVFLMIDGLGRFRIGKVGFLFRGGKNWVNSTFFVFL